MLIVSFCSPKAHYDYTHYMDMRRRRSLCAESFVSGAPHTHNIKVLIGLEADSFTGCMGGWLEWKRKVTAADFYGPPLSLFACAERAFYLPKCNSKPGHRSLQCHLHIHTKVLFRIHMLCQCATPAVPAFSSSCSFLQPALLHRAVVHSTVIIALTILFTLYYYV